MVDLNWGELGRRWQLDRDAAGEIALLADSLRRGLRSQQDFEFAALCGHEPSRVLLNWKQGFTDAKSWVRVIGEFERRQDYALICAAAFLQSNLDAVPEAEAAERELGQSILLAIQKLAACPCPNHRRELQELGAAAEDLGYDLSYQSRFAAPGHGLSIGELARFAASCADAAENWPDLENVLEAAVLMLALVTDNAIQTFIEASLRDEIGAWLRAT